MILFYTFIHLSFYTFTFLYIYSFYTIIFTDTKNYRTNIISFEEVVGAMDCIVMGVFLPTSLPISKSDKLNIISSYHILCCGNILQWDMLESQRQHGSSIV